MAIINGTVNNDFLFGTKSADVFDGGIGADTMTGYSGNDTYYVNDADDKIVEAAGEGTDTIISSVNYMLGAGVENLTLTGAAVVAFGNDLNNAIIGNDSGNTLNGGSGKDTMTGGKGDDYYYVDNAGDKVVETLSEAAGGGSDTINSTVTYSIASLVKVENLVLDGSEDIDATGNAGENYLSGNDHDNVLTGGGGNDWLEGGHGDDTLKGGIGEDRMEGGTGNDTYHYDGAGDQVIEAAMAGVDTIISTVAMANAVANVENYIFNASKALDFTGSAATNQIHGGSGNDVIHGNGGQDYLYGNGGGDKLFGGDAGDWLDGEAGADTMTGGKGDDIYMVDNAGDKVVESAAPGSGSDKIYSTLSIELLTENVEIGVLLGSGNTHATGNDADNHLAGNSGANLLDGKGGADTMNGGKGDDAYLVDNLGDKVVETLSKANGGGLDFVQSSIDFSLASLGNVENLQLIGSAIKATGNALENYLTGNAEDNILDGGKGADTLNGGAGNDTYVMDNAGDLAIENGNDTDDSLITTLALATSISKIENYTFNTNAAVHFTADAADNTITGGSGADIIDGNGGHDTLFGGAGNDSLSGGSLQDILDGGKGADLMLGGNHNDIYYVDNVGDQVLETAAMNSGQDAVFSTISIGLLWDNVEGLHLLGTGALNATGNDADNFIAGNSGNNVLDGAGGGDFLIGDHGNDTMTGGAGADTFFFDLGTFGNEGHDTITDFMKASDVLQFQVGDYNGDSTVDLDDLLASSSVVDHGAGKAVDVTFADGGTISFAGAGTGAVNDIADLVTNAATQIQVM